MLYVFLVNSGRMIMLDVELAVSTVKKLRETISRQQGIPTERMWLLVSGGYVMQDEKPVCSYGAGPESNPIYLFVSIGLNDTPESEEEEEDEIDTDLHSNEELMTSIHNSYSLTPGMEAIRKRLKLSKILYENDCRLQAKSEMHIKYQHFQQQGYSALLACCSDVAEDFQRRVKEYRKFFDEHFLKRADIIRLLNDIDAEIDKLSRLTILPALFDHANVNFSEFDEYEESKGICSTTAYAEDRRERIPSETIPVKRTISECSANSAGGSSYTLLKWLNYKEKGPSVKATVIDCRNQLEKFNEQTYARLREELKSNAKVFDMENAGDIDFLCERLGKFERHHHDVKRLLKDQEMLSASISKNERDASRTGDQSVMVGLCESHQLQLKSMGDTHMMIFNYSNEIRKGKSELCDFIKRRMRKIMNLNKAINTYDEKLFIYRQSIKRLDKQVVALAQIRTAPELYVAAVTETVRRKLFANEFQAWAGQLVKDYTKIYSEELQRRQSFNSRFDGHFLNMLFPGMADKPTMFFNTDDVPVFDAHLPNLTESDIKALSEHLEEDLLPHVDLPDMTRMRRFFQSYTSFDSEMTADEQRRIEFSSQEPVEGCYNLGERQQMPQEASVDECNIQYKPVRKLLAQGTSGIGSCDDCDSDTEAEFEKVAGRPSSSTASKPAGVLTAAVGTSTSLLVDDKAVETEETESSLVEEVNRLKLLFKDLSIYARECLRLARNCCAECRSNLTECQNALHADFKTVERQLKLVSTTSANYDILEDKLDKKEAEVQELQDQLQNAQQVKEVAVAVACEKLLQEHKTEIEILRQSLNNMTSESSDPTAAEHVGTEESKHSEPQISVIEHERLLAENRAQWLAERENSVKQSRQAERNAMSSLEVIKALLEDKERQLTALREQYQELIEKNSDLRSTVKSMNESGKVEWLEEKILYLNREISRLSDELSTEKTKRRRLKSITSSSQENVNIGKCKKGEQVLLTWSAERNQYVAMEIPKDVIFLHPETLSKIKLPADGITYALGEVFDVEKCITRKDVNRYRLPKDTSFYRVKVTPIDPPSLTSQPVMPTHTPTSNLTTEAKPIHRSASGDATDSLMGQSCASIASVQSYASNALDEAEPPSATLQNEAYQSLPIYQSQSACALDLLTSKDFLLSLSNSKQTVITEQPTSTRKFKRIPGETCDDGAEYPTLKILSSAANCRLWSPKPGMALSPTTHKPPISHSALRSPTSRTAAPQRLEGLAKRLQWSDSLDISQTGTSNVEDTAHHIELPSALPLNASAPSFIREAAAQIFSPGESSQLTSTKNDLGYPGRPSVQQQQRLVSPAERPYLKAMVKVEESHDDDLQENRKRRRTLSSSSTQRARSLSPSYARTSPFLPEVLWSSFVPAPSKLPLSPRSDDKQEEAWTLSVSKEASYTKLYTLPTTELTDTTPTNSNAPSDTPSTPPSQIGRQPLSPSPPASSSHTGGTKDTVTPGSLSVGTTSEDSDEYRSLEGRDDGSEYSDNEIDE